MFTHLDKLREIDVSNENQLETSKDEVEIVSTFKASQGYVVFLNFVCDLNRAVVGKSISAVKKQYESDPNSVTAALLNALDAVNALMDQAPPHAQRGRFGNPAFRTFLKLLQESQEQLQAPLFALIPSSEESKLSLPTAEVKAEAGVYLSKGFGDERRIDYGTGHEANFVCWLACLKQLGVFAAVPADKTEAFHATLVCLVFDKYLSIIRKLQTHYWLEPAGSRGVWGLDDYHFLPFFWGAAQLRGHPRIRPKSVRYPEILEGFSHEYMYLASLQFIHDVKVCSFAEHSPLLNDITAVKTWDKVNEGLLKMYNKDVLGRFAVVQHFIYSSILPKTPATEPLRDDGVLADAAADSHDHCGHDHSHSQGPKKELPCCSDAIRFPSAVAASKTSGISARLAAANPPLLL